MGVDQTLVFDVQITYLSSFPLREVELICSTFFLLQWYDDVGIICWSWDGREKEGCLQIDISRGNMCSVGCEWFEVYIFL